MLKYMGLITNNLASQKLIKSRVIYDYNTFFVV